MLFVLLVRAGLWMGMTRARDLIIDSAPILAWHWADPDAAFGHAPAHHPRPLFCDYHLHTLLGRGIGLPVLFLLSPTNVNCWSMTLASSRSVHDAFAWMLATGDSRSSRGSIRS